MQNILNQKKDLLIVVEKGTFFYPAFTHYGKETNVCCDFCSKSNLDSCIGYGDKDLCLRCVELFVENEKNKNLHQLSDLYRHPQQQTNPHFMTRMMQDSVRRNTTTSGFMTTNMMQDSVRRNTTTSGFMTTNMMQDSVRRNTTGGFMENNMKQDSIRHIVNDPTLVTYMMQNSTRPKSLFNLDGDY